MLSSAGPAVLAALVLLHGGGFAMGYWVSKSIGMEERMARTNSIEVSEESRR